MSMGTRRRLLMAAAAQSSKRQIGTLSVGDEFVLPATINGEVYHPEYVVVHKGAPSDATNFMGSAIYVGFSGGVIVMKRSADKWAQTSVEMSGWANSVMQTNLLSVYQSALPGDVYNSIMPVSIPCNANSGLNYQMPISNQYVWVPSAAEYGATDTADGAAFDYFSGADAAARRVEANGNEHATRSFYEQSQIDRKYYYYYTVNASGAISRRGGLDAACPTVYARVCMVLPETFEVEAI